MLGEPENASTDTRGLPSAARSLQPPVSALPPKEIWKPRDLLLFVAFTPLALLASTLAVLMAYTLLRPFAGWGGPVDLAQKHPLFLLIVQFIFYMLILGFLFLLAKIQHQQPLWQSLGWKKPTARQAAGYLVVGGGLAIMVNWLLWMQPDAREFPLEQLFNSRTVCYAIGAFAIAVAPAVEELVFRGLLFAILERTVGMPFAVVVTAILFAGLHVQEYWPAWHHMMMILLVGLVFSLARGMTGSLTPSIIIHVGYNSLMMAGLFFSTQHFRTAGGFGMQ